MTTCELFAQYFHTIEFYKEICTTGIDRLLINSFLKNNGIHRESGIHSETRKISRQVENQENS